MQNRSFIKIFSHGQITDLTNGFTFEKSLVFSIFAVPKSSSSPDVFTLNARLVGDTVASAVPIAVNRWNHVAIVEIQPDTQLLSQYDLYWGGSEDDYGQGGQPVPPTPPVPTPKTIIKYSTSDGQPVALTAPERFVDASGTPVPILYNTVNEDGHGELAFDGFVDCINGATFTNSRLACIHLPEEITSLGNYVFQGCPVLEYIELGSRVTVLGYAVIDNTPLARYLVCKGSTPPTISNSTLKPTLTDFKAYVPDVSADTYRGNRHWRPFITPMSQLPDCGKCQHDPPCPPPPEPEPLPVPTQREVMYRSTTGQILSPRSVSGFLDASGNAVTLNGNAYASTSNYGELDFADTIEEIGYSAYLGVEELEEVRLPDTVKRITSAAFRYCSNLKKIHFGSGLQIIGGQSLGSCVNLKEIIIEAPTVVTLDKNALFNTPADCVIKVRSNLVEQYKVANNWSSHADYIVAL